MNVPGRAALAGKPRLKDAGGRFVDLPDGMRGVFIFSKRVFFVLEIIVP